MLQRSIANLPLHSGSAPRWLFQRMERLAGAIVELIIADFGPDEMLARLGDPHWFQALGCVLGFDWHSSGLTTVTCGAIQQAYRRRGPSLGIHVAGGKGGRSRRTPDQIAQIAEQQAISIGDSLIYASRLSAKVDSAALQDGFDLYHHCFFFADNGHWTVVQQGMNTSTRYARRYHWYADGLIDFVNEPHAGIITQQQAESVLNMVAGESAQARGSAVEIVGEHPAKILAEVPVQGSLFLPRRHEVVLTPGEFDRLDKLLTATQSAPVESFEQLLGMKNVGPKTIRALALVAELIYDAPASRRDPARYSFAHGGKDGFPFPVQREAYDDSITQLEQAVRRTRIDPNEKDRALRRLQQWVSATDSGGRSG